MNRRASLTCVATALLLASSPPALAADRPVLDLAPTSLWEAIGQLARRTGSEIIFAPGATSQRSTPRLRGRMSVETALSRLLEGSGLAFRVTSDGTFVIYADSRPAAPPPRDEIVTLPELLVTGMRTQNSDIRRGQDDIQPYRVFSSDDIAGAGAADLDDFLRTRLVNNGQAVSAAQDPSREGSNRSQIDLRGLGANQTLVLIDGRRLAGLPAETIAFLQPDLNGVPLAAIDRVEVVTATAGGVYGPGATAGAVNVVLRRDYRGAEIGVTHGVSARGDAASTRIDGRLGFSPDGGTSDVMIAFSRTWGATLRVGDRDYAAQARSLRMRNDPVGFAQEFPAGSTTNIWSANGELSLIPALGGARLGATRTFVPANYGGVATDRGAALAANAGDIDTSLAAAGSNSLIVRPTISSGLINYRRWIGTKVEVYLDLLGLDNQGSARVQTSPRFDILPAGSPINPFAQTIFISYPTPAFDRVLTSRIRTGRATSGAIVDLGHAWKANLDYSFGATAVRNASTGGQLSGAYSNALASGLVNPLGDQAAFHAALETYRLLDTRTVSQTNHFRDGALRLAGPLTRLPGGPLTLTLLAEDRREHVPESRVNSGGPTVLTPLSALPELTQAVRSYYAELRAPLVARDGGPPGLSGLELQLAVRRDRNVTTLPVNAISSEPNKTLFTARETAVAYTAGFKVHPARDVMLRASVATGVLPPAIDQIASTNWLYLSDPDATPKVDSRVVVTFLPPFMAPRDPKRGHAVVSGEASFTARTGGSTDLRSEHARTLSAGFVLTPRILDGLRVSLDYTRIDKTQEIVDRHRGDLQYFIDDEDLYPGRVTRAPLTDADRARGYTGGVITAIDATSLNSGRTVVEAVDLQADYRLATRVGDFVLSNATTWQPRLSRRGGLDDARFDQAGHADGPLTWRSSGAIDWFRGPWGLGLAVQYYGRYLIAQADATTALAEQMILQQGATIIPAQTYVDLTFRYRLTSAGAGPRSTDLRLGVLNVLDHRPPILGTAGSLSYSPYGDPRGRRFEMSVTSRF